jgi:hypothetical protein
MYPDIERIRAEMRAQICRDCPLRTLQQPFDPERPLACEQSCPLFVHLPKLKVVAQQMDPMLRSYDRVLGEHLSEINRAEQARSGADGRSSPLRRYRNRIIRLFAGVMDRDAGRQKKGGGR